MSNRETWLSKQWSFLSYTKKALLMNRFGIRHEQEDNSFWDQWTHIPVYGKEQNLPGQEGTCIIYSEHNISYWARLICALKERHQISFPKLCYPYPHQAENSVSKKTIDDLMSCPESSLENTDHLEQAEVRARSFPILPTCPSTWAALYKMFRAAIVTDWRSPARSIAVLGTSSSEHSPARFRVYFPGTGKRLISSIFWRVLFHFSPFTSSPLI